MVRRLTMAKATKRSNRMGQNEPALSSRAGLLPRKVFNLDDFIADLLALGNKPVGTMFNFNASHFSILCRLARDVLMAQPSHLELSAPVKLAGDLHGQYYDLLRLFHFGGLPPHENYLFLGDYVDRGLQSLETICLLLALKVKYPENFFLLRGNHECANISRVYGFFDECKRRYNLKVWMNFVEVFAVLPYTALVDNKILCLHGGLSPELHHLAQLTDLKRPHGNIPTTGLLCDLLWSDPNPGGTGWGPNDRGVSYTFGADVLKTFCSNNDIDLVCRAHQVVEEGFEFFGQRKLVTIFSAPNYCQEFDNSAALLSVGETLECHFIVWKSDGFKKHMRALHMEQVAGKGGKRGRRISPTRF